MQETGAHSRPERGATIQPGKRAPSQAAAAANPPAPNLRSPAAAEGSPRNRRAAPRPSVLTGARFTWITGAFAAGLAFTVVLWLTSPAPVPPGAAMLASASVSDATSLMAAVQNAGLRGAPDVKGEIEQIRRIDNERVTIKGWAADKTGSSPQLAIVAFAGGTHVLTTMTNGPGTDIAKLFDLSGVRARDVSFEADFTCNSGQNLLVVAVSSDRTYSQFRSLACP